MTGLAKRWLPVSEYERRVARHSPDVAEPSLRGPRLCGLPFSSFGLQLLARRAGCLNSAPPPTSTLMAELSGL